MQKEIQLTDKTLLVVGLPSNFKYGEVIFDEFWYSTTNRKLSETGKVIELGSLGYELLGIYPELTEERAKMVVDSTTEYDGLIYANYLKSDYEAVFSLATALESFQSLMDVNTIWTVNPYEGKPNIKDYKDADLKAGDYFSRDLYAWQDAETKTFNKFAILIKIK